MQQYGTNKLGAATVCRYPIDLEKLPEEVAEILEVAATDMEAQLASSGQQATHTALEALALAVLDMSIVDATIAFVSEQLSSSSRSFIDGHSTLLLVCSSTELRGLDNVYSLSW